MRTRENTFRKYDHLERRDHREVRGLEAGLCWIFPKIDGTNASIYFDPELDEIMACSRNRVLGPEKQDNHGFHAWVHAPDQAALRMFCRMHPQFVVYGEWLVPHSLKTYTDDSWRRFYVFDVFDREDESYLSYDEYAKFTELEWCIPPLCTIVNPTKADLLKIMEGNTYLIKDGEGIGEGIVIKNYGWKNFFGRQPWAKLVRNAFKETNKSAFGTPRREATKQVEVEIVNQFVTEALVRKELAKILNAVQSEDRLQRIMETEFMELSHAQILAERRKRVIPWILSQTYNCLIEEELWSALKKHRNPTIDFKLLQGLVTHKVKELLPEIF